jgi:hypothetical protein
MNINASFRIYGGMMRFDQREDRKSRLMLHYGKQPTMPGLCAPNGRNTVATADEQSRQSAHSVHLELMEYYS